MDVEILLFDGFDELDAIGPYEVLTHAGDRGADLPVRTVTIEPAETVTASHGLTIQPDGELGQPDLLVVPGGGWEGGGARREYDADDLPQAIADRHGQGSVVASVCTGAMLLAGGGLLDGRPATTHHLAHGDLAAVTERVDARVVDDGDVLTAAGVSSGLDLALWIVEREFGRELADVTAEAIEYEPRHDVYESAAAA
ncbi:MAG: DJ-1/PfpI family protein [Halobacteriales archaeon]